MARTIQQIKQDLASLEEAVATLGVDLQNLYVEYLNLLSQSVPKQLALAAYQICTQSYPESFLRLSFKQRQQLQQNLRQIAKQIQPQLIFSLNSANNPTPSEQKNSLGQIVNSLPLTQEQQNLERQSIAQKVELQEATSTPNPENPENPEVNSDRHAASDEQKLKQIANPEELCQWQQKLEQVISQNLEKISTEANRCLQQAYILPSKLPPKLFEVALQAEASGSTLSNSPNLLTILLETDPEQKSENANITQITAIHLRLSEIDFSNPTLSNKRNQIRNLLAKISTIRQQYPKKKRELAIVEAEAAWRSSWFED